MICNNSYNVLQINENDVMITRAHRFLEKQNDYVTLINKRETLFDDCRDCFAINLGELGKTNLVKMSKDNVPIVL